MICKVINSHADIQALYDTQSQQEQGIRSDERKIVQIDSLESVRIAHESYVLLCQLVDQGWSCSRMDLLSVVGNLSLELNKIERDLLPPLQGQETKMEGRVVQALLGMRNSAIAILRLVKRFRRFETLEGLISSRAQVVGTVLEDATEQVLRGTQDIAWLKEKCVPPLVELMAIRVSIF
uniref:Uncharacterized protein n=1 Tax=Leersia perrieri TaxID=77586 RepID=A0A0D9XPR5_9ORYZ